MDAAGAEAYLARIGYAGPRAPRAETLRAVHRAHVHAVPFENLDIHLGRPIPIDPAAWHRKIVGERRGGFCYELNGLFGELLAFLGFGVSRLSARVAHDAGGFGPELDHLTLLVTAGDRYLADVGFGRCFHEPLSLDAPHEEEAEGLLYRALADVDGDGWRVESRRPGGEARPEYAFTLKAHPLEAFAGMCAWHQTSPASHFTQNVLCSLPFERGRRTLRGRTLIETEGDARRETPLDDEARAEVLATCFGIRLPVAPSWAEEVGRAG